MIYHDPACGASQNTLAMIRSAGFETHVIEYLKTPPRGTMVASLLTRRGASPREPLRAKEKEVAELRLNDPAVRGERLLDAMRESPSPSTGPSSFH